MPKAQKITARTLIKKKSATTTTQKGVNSFPVIESLVDKKKARKEKWTERLSHFYEKKVEKKLLPMDMTSFTDMLALIPETTKSSTTTAALIKKRPVSQKALRKSK